MNSTPILLHFNEPSANDIRLRRLAESLGLTCNTLDISRLRGDLDRATDYSLCILTSAKTLFDWCDYEGPNHRASVGLLRQKTRFLFVYGCAPNRKSRSIASTLTDGEISDVRQIEELDLNYRVTSCHPELVREFSGLSFGPIRKQIDFGFICSPASVRSLISIGSLPFWALFATGGCRAFLLACDEIVDIKEKTEGSLDVVKYFSRLLPAAMFLKWALPNRCWRSQHRFANFIIDDPLLKKSYGHLNYKDLLGRMDRSNFATTIAFIPWNYKRTEKATAQLFRDRPDRLSLCIHGCDHSNAEFATHDLADLNRRLQLASNRMNAHRANTGLPHSSVMVFPQGRFSREALKALKCNNYLAAVNSCATAASSGMEQEFSVSDFLELAITKFGGYPLYLRRYPGSLEQFAFDLFFGKPLLVVEHQAYFKDRYKRLIEFVARLNAFGLEWKGLNEVLQKSYLERETSDQATACKLYTNSTVIENHSDRDRLFTITKAHSDVVPVDRILLNDKTADFTVTDRTMEFSVTIPRHASVRVDVAYKNILPVPKPQRTFTTAGRVWTRRMLSEFRDNFLCRSELMQTTARAMNKRFPGQRPSI